MIAEIDRLRDIAASVLEGFFEDEFHTVEEFRGWSDFETVTALVRFSDAWYGAVATTCTVRMARGLAAVMFELEPEEVGDEEVEDALGEVANMVGRHVKQVLPEGTRLSVPTIHPGDDVIAAVPGGSIAGQVAFNCGGEQIVVTAYEAAQDGQG